MITETRDHLLQALHGEAFAFAHYMLYAEAARRNGRHELADLFERIAHTERFEHFAEEAELAGVGGEVMRTTCARPSLESGTRSKPCTPALRSRRNWRARRLQRTASPRSAMTSRTILAAFERALEQLEQGAQDIRHEQSGAAR